eukprot:TRINITY_DN24405_c0_g2_i1.p3 TRINITY_DN24405_c0_g2~~TRINITY_DN24405_c0_g2_i1.p3  ORF type:complete len:125 (+),score=34.22 TRINITY_DN24405_c0_g2_i1:40-414(+)
MVQCIFFKDTGTTEIYTRSIVGSVRCVQETGKRQEEKNKKSNKKSDKDKNRETKKHKRTEKVIKADSILPRKRRRAIKGAGGASEPNIMELRRKKKKQRKVKKNRQRVIKKNDEKGKRLSLIHI